MKTIIRTTLATALAAACLAGASVTFAADNGNNGDGGKNNPGSGISSNPGRNDNDSDVLQTDPTQTNSTTTTCDNNAANQQNCTKDGMEQTPQTQQ